MNFSIVDDDEEPDAPVRPSDSAEEVSAQSGPVVAAWQDETTRVAEGRSEPGLSNLDAERTLNVTELARKFNMTRNLVMERIEEHPEIVPVHRGGRLGTRYRVADVEAILVLKIARSDRKLEATERKLEAEADLKEIEVAKKRGEMIFVSEIELGSVQFFRTLYNSLMTYFADSALDISRLRTRGEVEHYQKIHGGKLLQKLRDDPNNALTKYLPEGTGDQL